MSWPLRAAVAHLRSWRVRIWAGLLATLALVLCQMPLFGVLGFEFSLVMSVAVSIAGADLGASLVWRTRTMGASRVSRALPPEKLVAHLFAGAAATAIALLALPLVIVCLNGLRVRNCDWGFGLRCFFLMPVLSAAFAACVGTTAGLLAGRKRWLCRVLPFALLLVSTLWSLLHFYTAPAVFSYNPFAGYFPGNIYDESIDLRAPFYWARAYHLGILLSLGSLLALWLEPLTLRLRKRRGPSRETRKTSIVAAAAVLTTSLLYNASGTLGFAVDADDVRRALPGRYESENFIIHYPAHAGLVEQIETIADDHEFRRAQLVRDLGVNPPGKITSYYFGSPEQKQELMGARNVYMAKPWRHEIYLNHQDFPHQVLRHEIAHVMAGAFGDAIFEVSAGRVLGLPVYFNVGMIEGTAVAADWPDHFNKALTPHQSVKAMLELGMPQPVETLFSTGFLSLSSARSYTLAGSYLRYLLDTYGIERLRAAYESGGDFKAAYGVPMRELTEGWKQHIAATELPQGAAQIIRERFRRKAIFDRPCPHAIARARDAMAEDLAVGNVKRAIQRARGVCSDVPGEPRYELQLASLLQTQAQRELADDARIPLLEEAHSILTAIADDAETTSSTLRAHARFALANMAMAESNTQLALEHIDAVLALPLGDNDMRQAVVLRTLLTHTGPAAASLRAIFWPVGGGDIDRLLLVGLAGEATMLEPELGLAHYLLGRQLRGRGDEAATVRVLKRALALPLATLVRREAARILAEAAYLARDMETLREAAAILVEPGQPEVTRLLGYDWLERAHWARTGKVPSEPLGWRDGKTRSGLP